MRPAITRAAFLGLMTCFATLGSVQLKQAMYRHVAEPATRPAQLYVADANGVEGFGLVHHHPSPPPDFSYAGVGAPIAVGPDGSVYVSSYLTVFVFPPGSPSFSRTLSVQLPKHSVRKYQQGIDSIALDRDGNMYVGFVYSYLRPNRFPTSVWTVYVYRPGAEGEAVPFRQLTIHTADMNRLWCHWYACHVGGLAFDAGDHQNELYIAWTDLVSWPEGCDCAGVAAYSNPTRRRGGITRSLTGSGVSNPYGVAVDRAHELYVDNLSGSGSFVAAYPPTANGGQAPDRVMTVAGEQSFGTGIAVAGQRLFIPDAGANQVYEVSSQVGGAQQPIATLTVSSAWAVAIGGI